MVDVKYRRSGSMAQRRNNLVMQMERLLASAASNERYAQEQKEAGIHDGRLWLYYAYDDFRFALAIEMQIKRIDELRIDAS